MQMPLPSQLISIASSHVDDHQSLNSSRRSGRSVNQKYIEPTGHYDSTLSVLDKSMALERSGIDKSDDNIHSNYLLKNDHNNSGDLSFLHEKSFAKLVMIQQQEQMQKKLDY